MKEKVINKVRRSRLFATDQFLPRQRTSTAQDSMTALSSADPGLPIDWLTESRRQAARNRPAVYLAALISVEDHAGSSQQCR